MQYTEVCVTNINGHMLKPTQDQWKRVWDVSGEWCGSMRYQLYSCSPSVLRLGRYYWTHIHLTYITTLLSQIKCVRYWPEKLHESLTVENKFRVTFSSNMPFAEYEFRKFKLENVSAYTIIITIIKKCYIPAHRG